jgi:RNA polymerase sigma factor (sigma-70 family)
LDRAERLDDTLSPLVRQAQGGDETAFRELVGRYYAQIHRWALSHTQDPDDADDVAQNVLVRLHLQLRRFRGRSQFTTWLYQVTRNSALDFHRSRLRREGALRRMQQMEPTNPPSEGDSASEVERADLLEVALAAFRRLPERQREVFDLVDLQGYAPVEAAGMLGVAAATARVHLLRARRAVRASVIATFPETAKEYE